MTENNFHKQNTQPSLLESSPTPPLPETIGPYKVETLLTKGSMSWLYMGIDPKTKTPVAIKVLPSSLIENKASLDLFLKESKLAALTDHPNIVKLYGEGSWEDGLYIAMEWVHGVSLRQFLMQHSFSLKRSLEIILQICYALKHLHAHHIIHRDLKPENILITEEGTIKVVDFGIAQMVEDKPLLASIKIIGTPNYMSPEQKEHPNELSYTTDIYSLGVLSYELILGKLSYGVIQTSLLPEKLRKIVNKALAVSVSQRYQTVDAFMKDLLEYLASGDLEKEKPSQDLSTEFFEVFQKNSGRLSPFPAPPWPFADIGIGKIKCSHKFGLYYDIFFFPNDCCLILIANPLEQGLDPLFSVANFRGTVRALAELLTKSFSEPLDTDGFIRSLKHLVGSDSMLPKLGFSYLLLDPVSDTCKFYNSGLSQLMLVPAGEPCKIVYNASAPLSENRLIDTSATTEPWKVGDVIIYHCLVSEETDVLEKREGVENYLKQVLKEQMLLSAQSQADALVRALSETSLLPQNTEMKVLFSIQRMS